MSPGSIVGPNDPCPCGSNKKYKRCCQSLGDTGSKKWKGILLGLLLIVATGGFVLGSMKPPKSASSVRFGPDPALPGVAPPGKVWSAEHGHWHDEQ